MSTLRVNKIVNLNDNGPVSFTQGATIPAGKTLSGDGSLSSTGAISSEDVTVTGNLTSNSGTITATAFSGVGLNLTNIPGTTVGQAIALTIIS